MSKIKNTELIPFWEKKSKINSFFEHYVIKKIFRTIKILFYFFSFLMIVWSFIQSFVSPYTMYSPLPGSGLEIGYLKKDLNETDVELILGSFEIAGPKYHAFHEMSWVYGPFLSWFVLPVAKFFIFLVYIFKKSSEFLYSTGLHVILAMLIIMTCMRIITFGVSLRSAIYQERQNQFQGGIDAINLKYKNYDPSDKSAKLKKHQEITEYNKKYNLKPFSGLENFFINTPIFLIVFKVITISRPVKFVNLFGIWDLSKTPSNMIFYDLFSEGWKYLLLCLIIIPVNFFTQKISTWLSKKRNPSLNREKDPINQAYKMQKMQKIMTILFLLFTFFWSTGLAIYYFFNSIFTVFQNLIIHFILIKKGKKNYALKMKLKKLGIKD